MCWTNIQCMICTNWKVFPIVIFGSKKMNGCEIGTRGHIWWLTGGASVSFSMQASASSSSSPTVNTLFWSTVPHTYAHGRAHSHANGSGHTHGGIACSHSDTHAIFSFFFRCHSHSHVSKSWCPSAVSQQSKVSPINCSNSFYSARRLDAGDRQYTYRSCMCSRPTITTFPTTTTPTPILYSPSCLS